MKKQLVIQTKIKNTKMRKGMNHSYSTQLVVTFNSGKKIMDCIGVFYYEGNKQYAHLNIKKLAFWLEKGASINSRTGWLTYYLYLNAN